jgi:hypothetical protein
MHMTPVVSDNVGYVGYEHSTQVLRVTFHGGHTYEYYDVPAHLYEAMFLPHPWRCVGRQIRAHRYLRIAA